MDFIPQAFQALATHRQFIVCTFVESKSRPGKTDKFPVDHRTGSITNAHDPAVWTDAQTALDASKRLGAGFGLGFVFTDRDPFWFLDIDNCYDPGKCEPGVQGSGWSEISLAMINKFPGALVEVSSSGRGLHIIGSGAVPSHSCRNEVGLEFYSSGRFVALTGTYAQGDAGKDFTPAVASLVESYFQPNAVAKGSNELWQWDDLCERGPQPDWRGPIDDQDLINAATAARSAGAVLNGGVTFKDLWTRNLDVLQRAYPCAHHESGFDESRADGALAQILAFWTGNDHDRIRRLMTQSELVRPKYERPDYLPRTILGVCSRQNQVCTMWANPKVSDVVGQDDKPRLKVRTNRGFLSLDDTAKHFEGCVYIADEHKVLMPHGDIVTPEVFRAWYGGYRMPLDDRNEKTTDDPYKAFINSQVFEAPKVHSTCFRPDLSFQKIIETEGKSFVNTYKPIPIEMVDGDVELMLAHIAILFPNQRDQEFVIAYMAALVQYPGIKFQWCPLIQGDRKS